MNELEKAIKELGLQHFAGLEFLGTDNPEKHWAVITLGSRKADGSVSEKNPPRALSYGLTWQEATAKVLKN